MTEFRGCWDVRRICRTHYIRSIDGESGATVPERIVGAVGEFGCVVLWVGVQLDAREARPSFRERVGDRIRSKDGVDALERNGYTENLDHLLQPRKKVVGLELIEGQRCTDKNGVCALRTGGDRENEI